VGAVMPDVDWTEVTKFFNGVIEEVDLGDPEESKLEVYVYSRALGKTLKVVIPNRLIESFMKHLPMYEAQVKASQLEFLPAFAE
jgi:hypothetical protein